METFDFTIGHQRPFSMSFYESLIRFSPLVDIAEMRKKKEKEDQSNKENEKEERYGKKRVSGKKKER